MTEGSEQPARGLQNPEDARLNLEVQQPGAPKQPEREDPARAPLPAAPPRDRVAALRPEAREVAEWLGRARAGDRSAFEALVHAYEAVVLRVARALVGSPSDAEDVAQEAFMRLFRTLPRLDPARDPIGWVYRLTVNAAWDLVDLRRRDRRLEEVLRQERAPGFRRERDCMEAAELREILRSSLQVLAPRMRAVFVLHEVEGVEVREVARILRISRITVRRHLSRARQSLQEHLRRSYPEVI